MTPDFSQFLQSLEELEHLYLYDRYDDLPEPGLLVLHRRLQQLDGHVGHLRQAKGERHRDMVQSLASGEAAFGGEFELGDALRAEQVLSETPEERARRTGRTPTKTKRKRGKGIRDRNPERKD